MAKRIIGILLSLILCIGVLPFTASAAEIASGTCGADGDNLTWVLTDDGTLTISGTGAMVDYDADNSPFFAYNNQIKKVVVESGVTTIGKYAFCEMSVTSVVIPATVTMIGYEAFSETESLKEVTFGENESIDTTLTIDSFAFLRSGVNSLAFPKHLESIGTGSFQICSALTKVVFNGGVDSLGNGAFANARGLTEIVFMSDAPRFIDDVFTSVIATVYYPADNTTWTPEKMKNYGGTLTYEAVESTSELSGTCGAEGDNLTWVLTDNGTLTISGTGEMYTGYGPPWEDYSLQIKTVIIENGVTSIGINAFSRCENLTSLSLANSILTIKDVAFIGCKNLAEVTLPSNLEIIADGAFSSCNSLVNVSIPASVTSIGMGPGAFAQCAKLEEINVDSQNIAYSSIDGVLFSKDGTTLYTYPCGKTGSYIIPNSVTTIQPSAFKNSIYLTEITVSGDISIISDNAFEGCSSLTNVKLQEGITQIQGGAFLGCNALEKIILPESTRIIEDAVFTGCPLQEIYLPDGLESIGSSALAWTNLTGVSIPSAMTTIAGDTFGGCKSLYSIVIPANITSIESYAFGDCDNLKNIYFEGNPPNIASDVFTSSVTATAHYPASNDTWTSDVMQNYGGNLTWEAVGAAESSYSAGLSSLSSDVEKGGTVTINVNATHESDSTYAASEIVLTYDSGKLQFNEAASTLGNATVKNENGTISLQDYGESKHLGNGIYIFAFDAIADGQATVTLTSAAFVNKDNAAQSDLISATISPSTLSIIIQKPSFGVTLPNIFTGAATVTEGESYTFTKADITNYNYGTVSATMNGQSVAVTDNKDGSYTIANVTGALVISGSRTEKAYTVSFSGNGAADVKDAATTATYNTAYNFTMPTASGWAYALDSITIGGKVYTGYSVADSVYTIPGSAINGDIAITITKTQTNAGVVVEGSGAGSASGNDTTVEMNKDYTLTVTPEAGYSYTVTATIDGKEVTVIDNGDNTYTVKNVTGNLVFTVEKTVIVSGVSVAEYLSLDGTTMWLVKNTTPVADGKVPTYDGNNMFYSEEYKAYCYLVIAETLSLEDAQKKVGITDGTATTVDYESMDVNWTDKVDAADAQVVYNMYKADYSAFTSDVTLEKFLMADVNGDGTVNLEDATAIVNKILS